MDEIKGWMPLAYGQVLHKTFTWKCLTFHFLPFLMASNEFPFYKFNRTDIRLHYAQFIFLPSTVVISILCWAFGVSFNDKINICFAYSYVVLILFSVGRSLFFERFFSTDYVAINVIFLSSRIACAILSLCTEFNWFGLISIVLLLIFDILAIVGFVWLYRSPKFSTEVQLMEARNVMNMLRKDRKDKKIVADLVDDMVDYVVRQEKHLQSGLMKTVRFAVVNEQIV